MITLPSLFRLWMLALAMPVVLMAQKTIEVRFEGELRRLGGFVVTFLLAAILAALAYLACRPNRVHESERSEQSGQSQGMLLLALASVLLLSNLWSDQLYGYTTTVPFGHATIVRLIVFVSWLAIAGGLYWSRAPGQWYVLAICGLVLLTRMSAILVDPENINGGDMLWNVNRVLDLLRQGEFPYIDVPAPAMPYWPATLLVYLPPHWLGIDLRWSNVVLETATALVAMAPVLMRRRVSLLDACLVPLMMLMPLWTHYGTNTQYAPTLFAAVLFAQFVLQLGIYCQGMALGLAVAASQTLGVLAIGIGPWWWRTGELRRTLIATALSLFACLIWTGPFLWWDGREFLRVTLVALDPMSNAQLAGRITLRPLLTSWHPSLPTLLAAVTIGVTFLLPACVRLTRSQILAVLSMAMFIVLTLLHRTFTHYYLPVLALMVLAAEGNAVQSDKR